MIANVDLLSMNYTIHSAPVLYAKAIEIADYSSVER